MFATSCSVLVPSKSLIAVITTTALSLASGPSLASPHYYATYPVSYIFRRQQLYGWPPLLFLSTRINLLFFCFSIRFRFFSVSLFGTYVSPAHANIVSNTASG